MDAETTSGDEATVEPPRVTVLTPVLTLTVTVEVDGVHLHPGGQGFWIARMVQALGCTPVIVAPVGGEAGRVIEALLPDWGITVVPVAMAADSPCYVHDRRSGERVEIMSTDEPTLDRHEADDLATALLAEGLASEGTVLTSAIGEMLPAEAYRRLAKDLGASERPVIADLHGPALEAVLGSGGLTALKVSDEDLRDDGHLIDDLPGAVSAARALAARGVGIVVISRAAEPAVAVAGGATFVVTPPPLTAADHRGAGDSMTGGLVAGSVLDLDPLDVIRLGVAAGAGNVVRRGLGSGDPDLIARLIDLVLIEPADD
jgi:1-phosphofructokinase